MKVLFPHNYIISYPKIPCSRFPAFTANPANSDTFTRKDALGIALNNLNNLTFAEQDIKKVESYGAKLPFKNGREAVQFAKSNNINVIFSKIDDESTHAQWCNNINTVVINNRYKNTTDSAEIFAISAALLHELSHAKDKDDSNSIQEEIDCLAMNALAFNVFKKQNPQLFAHNQSALLDDGVKIYTDLFFGNDENALINRIRSKYGELKLSSPNHSASLLAYKIKISLLK